MTDAPRPDLTAADWAAMRGRVEAAKALHANLPGAYWGHLRENMAEEHFTLLVKAITDLPLALDSRDAALDALARQQEANARLTAALAAAQFDRDEAIKDFRFGVHHDCRPNRKQAESWRDQLRDETDRHADTKAALADRDATIARLREQWERECADTDRVLIGLGFSPETGRTEGGSLHLGRILAKCVTLEHIQQRVIEADATIARLREAQTWQPIETAPKDGTEVLAWRGGRRGIVRWHENSSYWDEWHRPTAHCRVEPTHWMPLPRTPAKEADRG